jgi:hypothetical protein
VLVFCWDLDTRFYPYLLGLWSSWR